MDAPRLNPSFVLSLIALVMASAGTGYAALGEGHRGGAVAAGNSRGEPVEIQVRNRSRGETGLVTASDDYSLRLSNTREGGGGGAVYGCRAPHAAPAQDLACLYADNLRGGEAFLFRSRQGPTVGHFDLGNPAGPPFTTNATGLVTNLNADKVDGLDAGQLQGQQGPAGPQGPQGPQGPPGPTAGSTDSNLNNEPIGLAQEVLATADITLATQSRLFAAGTVTARSDGGGNDEAICRVRDGTGGLGRAVLSGFPDSVIPLTTLSPLGSDVRPAGTHTVELTCNLGAGAFTAERSELIVWAVAE